MKHGPIQENGRMLLIAEDEDDEHFLQQIQEIRDIVKRIGPPPVIHLWSGGNFEFDPVCGELNREDDGQTVDLENCTCPRCMAIVRTE